MGLASCASKAQPFSKAITTMRKPLSRLLRKTASTAPATSCSLIPPPKSTATLNVSSYLLFTSEYDAIGHFSANVRSGVRLIR